MLLLEGEEKERLPKFGVLISILAHEIKSLLSKLEALYNYNCGHGWYLYLVSKFEPVLTCSSRDIHVNTQKNQNIYSLVWYHCKS